MAKVLLIDDDVDLVDMNKLVLTSRGHEVAVAYSAQEARAALEKLVPDVAVIDVMMESESAGIELAREIHDRFPGLPTLILSSVHKAKQLPYRFVPDETWLPVLKFIDKPIAPAALADQIEALLK